MNGTKHSMIAQYTRVYEDKMAMGEHKHLIFPWHLRLEAKHGETNKQRSMSVSCSQTILMISHHLPCWKNVNILLHFLPSALFLKQSWSLIGVEMWWLWSYGHGAAENSPLWGKKISVVGVLKWYPKKKLSLSLSIKCANDVHGHYYFGGDEEWQSVTSRFKIVLVEGYHRFEWVWSSFILHPTSFNYHFDGRFASAKGAMDEISRPRLGSSVSFETLAYGF